MNINKFDDMLHNLISYDGNEIFDGLSKAVLSDLVDSIEESQKKELIELFQDKSEANTDNGEELFGKKLLFSVVGMESPRTLSTGYRKKDITSLFHKLHSLKEKGIKFDPTAFKENPSTFATAKIKDGLCTAMALTCIKYIYAAYSEPDDYAKNLIEAASHFKEGAPQEVALIQSVFNTIVVSKKAEGDTRNAKMQSMANLFDLKLVNPSPVIKIVEKMDGNEAVLNRSFFQQLKAYTEEMAEGIYVIRLLWNLQNNDVRKDERMGHTLVFLKGNDKSYLFDPGIAMVEMDSQDIPLTLVADFQHWETRDELRFYQVEPK